MKPLSVCAMRGKKEELEQELANLMQEIKELDRQEQEQGLKLEQEKQETRRLLLELVEKTRREKELLKLVKDI